MIDPNTIYKDLPPRTFGKDADAETAKLFNPDFGLDISDQPKWKISDKVTIVAQPVGAPVMRSKNPNQPYTTKEILNSCIECVEAGATCVHVHVRQDNGVPVEDAKNKVRLMHEVVDPLREKYGYSIIIDGSECTMVTFEEEKEMLDAGLSEVVPVNLGHMTPDRLAQAEAYYLESKGIKPGLAVHGIEDIEQAKRCLIDTKLIKPPVYWGILPTIFGGTPLPNQVAMAEYMIKLIKRVEEVSPDYIITVPTPGRPSTYLATLGILMGLDIRVGMEDTYVKWPHKDDVIDNCAKMVSDMIGIAKSLGRRVATADETRIAMGLAPKMKK